ncbi:hypothetical protein, partial [Bradyrhizobium sp. MOS001]|uniref:hypothetical protein n=1 Tax=Bradyrhizobium sp. MOS001 TaxID=2133948 RepID=UPI001961E19E
APGDIKSEGWARSSRNPGRDQIGTPGRDHRNPHVLELANAGSLDLDRYLGALDETVDAHKSSGDPNRLAEAIAAIRSHISESTNSSQGEKH